MQWTVQDKTWSFFLLLLGFLMKLWWCVMGLYNLVTKLFLYKTIWQWNKRFQSYRHKKCVSSLGCRWFKVHVCVKFGEKTFWIMLKQWTKFQKCVNVFMGVSGLPKGVVNNNQVLGPLIITLCRCVFTGSYAKYLYNRLVGRFNPVNRAI